MKSISVNTLKSIVSDRARLFSQKTGMYPNTLVLGKLEHFAFSYYIAHVDALLEHSDSLYAPCSTIWLQMNVLRSSAKSCVRVLHVERL